MGPLEYFVGNLILRNFCLKYFSIQSVFFRVFSSKLNFLILMHYNISKMQIFKALSSTPGVDRDTRPLNFF